MESLREWSFAQGLAGEEVLQCMRLQTRQSKQSKASWNHSVYSVDAMCIHCKHVQPSWHLVGRQILALPSALHLCLPV